MIIAIDGPAGAGKSIISKLVAQKLGAQLIDTGAMFRVVALFAKKNGISWENGEKLGKIAEKLHFRFDLIAGKNNVFVNEIDITNAIRTDAISLGASQVSVFPQVRNVLLKRQRALANTGNIVMEGRDIGTIVFPKADVKIYLTATVQERARRRFHDEKRGKDSKKLLEIEKEIEERDYRDKNRTHAPLRCAKDAYMIESTNKTIEEVVLEILNLCT